MPPNGDHPDAMSNLGVLLDGRGDTVEAEQFYRRAVDLDHPAAMFNLGVLLDGHGDTVEPGFAAIDLSCQGTPTEDRRRVDRRSSCRNPLLPAD